MPTTSSTSPTLNTLASGSPFGMANTSPRNHRGASSVGTELSKSASSATIPARRAAPGDAGITPPLVAMASTFNRPPRVRIHRPLTRRRFTTTNHPASAYVNRWTADASVCGMTRLKTLRMPICSTTDDSAAQKARTRMSATRVS